MIVSREMFALLLESIARESVTWPDAEWLVEERDKALLAEQKAKGRIAGLEQGIHAANETARRFSARAKLAHALDGEKCNVVAVVVGAGRDYHTCYNISIRCSRLGFHDEHRFEEPASDGQAAVKIELRTDLVP